MTTRDWGSIYKELGATPVVNATGSVTFLGGSTPNAEVKAAMDAADSAFIPLIHLEQVAGDRIAEMLGVPAAYITSGAGSALTLSTAAFMAGTDEDKIQQLPNTTGMPNEILIQKRQRYWYDRCLEFAGATLVDVGDDDGTTADDLRAAISDRTAAVHWVAYEQNPVDPDVLTLEETIEITHAAGKPVSVDAAGQIFPLENFGKYVKMGADFQCIAAKYMGAPHSTGIALGTKEVIEAISRHSFVGYETHRIRGIGRPHKIDRQEIMGVVAAVERWMTLNHEDRMESAEAQSQEILTPLQDIPGVTAWLNPNIMGHQPYGVHVKLDPDVVGFTIDDLIQKLRDGDPSIWTRSALDGQARLDIHVFGLNDGEAELVGNAIAAVIKG
ncbi:MAG: aminotransferase class V-fold PLP-dependent enzyme [Gammaproteobacteria bacterium]|nr:aminotransferase class V-fold PLP-dependent enzyme [Gammaproteobacteria bacterium]